MKIRTALIAALLAAAAGCAAADTPQEVFAQAQEPWQETIEAYGREIVIDVTPQMPDVEALGICRVTTISAQEMVGEPISRVQAPKMRGYANRTKTMEIPYAEIDRELYAYGNPVSAGEALDRVQAFMEPVLAGVQGVDVRVDAMTVRSPVYSYNKETGEWGEQVYDGEVGTYSFSFVYTLEGVEIVQQLSFPEWWDSESGVYDAPRSPSWMSHVYLGENGYEVKTIQAPSVVETTAQEVELAPLDAVKESLRELASRGLLRDVASLRLVYLGYGYAQEQDVWELRPTWICDAEMYWNQEADQESTGYEPWYESVLIDARTGEIIQGRWADGEPQREETQQAAP